MAWQVVNSIMKKAHITILLNNSQSFQNHSLKQKLAVLVKTYIPFMDEYKCYCMLYCNDILLDKNAVHVFCPHQWFKHELMENYTQY